ncbi:MAG: MFS transporter [Caldilineae bacterium]|nr:MAG: MFS transporter [Caldilineae bacterium]
MIRPLLALGLALLGMAALGPVYNTFVPILLQERGLNATLVGFVMTWDNWLNAFIPPWVGVLSDRYWTRLGRRKPWILLGTLLAMTYILIPVAPGLVAMLVVILVSNLGLAVVRSPGLALLGDLFEPHERSAASGVINVFGGLGVVLTLVAGRYLFPSGALLPFLFTAAVFAVGVAVLMLVVVEPRHRRGGVPRWSEAPWSVVQPLRGGDGRRWGLIGGVFAAFCGFGVAETWLTSYAHYGLGVPEERLPLLMAAFAAALLLSAVPSGLLATPRRRKGVVMAGAVALTVVLVSAMAVQTVEILYIVLVLAGVAWAPILINTLPLLYDVAGEKAFGATTGVYYLTISLAGVLGPQIVGVVLDLSGRDYRLIWPIAALFMGLGALLIGRIEIAAGEREAERDERAGRALASD